VTESCHATTRGLPAEEDGGRVVALVGTSNVGKSTLFNSLCGARQSIGNWPGTTVEVARADWRPPSSARTDRPLRLLDLPGTASLAPVSPDEELTRDLLVEAPPGSRPDVVVAVVDAAHLARSLYLVAQLRERSQRLVVAVTMADVAARRGLGVDADALARAVAVPVVVVDPRRRDSSSCLGGAVLEAMARPAPAPRTRAATDLDPDDPFAEDDERFGWVQQVLEAAVEHRGDGGPTWTDRIDRVVTAPVLGPLVFLAVMWAVFQVTTAVAAPLQDALDGLVSGPVTAGASALLGLLGLGGSAIEGFVLDGLIAGVGMLLTFVPLMALMFGLLAVLESSGYLARAAVVTDRTMRAVGLPGRAFLPLVVGFGCNVPAISATRVLPDSRQRLLTSMLVPFTGCSARLAVFALVGATFFGPNAGTVVFGMYLASILLVVGVGLLLRGTLWRTLGADPLVIDLPPYHLPLPRQVALVTWSRVRAFLHTAGGIIVVTVAAVWVLSAVPAPGASGSVGEVPVEDSLYAASAETLAPVFAPAGFGDWHATSALMVGFVAKEAVISSWAQTYATEEPTDTATPGALGDAVQADFAASSGGHTTAAVLAFLVFLLAYTPCVATLAALRREVGTRWMLTSVGLSLSVAWLLAVAVFQVGRLIA
jgi:ferrous iron transport protein B